MKMVKILGLSLVLLGVVVLSSGCNNCGVKCEPVNDCAPVVTSCSPCGR